MAKFTLEFGPQSTARLEEIAKAKEMSRADVVRRALEVYSQLLEATKEDDGKVIVQTSSGTKELMPL